MNDLSLYILDLCQNAIKAKATLLEIEIEESPSKNLLSIKIKDNGVGIKTIPNKAIDPFYTTRTTRKVGMGLSLFNEVVTLANGRLDIKSSTKGTTLFATMEYNHIDRLEIGNIEETIIALIFDETYDVRFVYKYEEKQFFFDTREIKKVLDGVSILDKDILFWIRETIKREITGIKSGGN